MISKKIIQLSFLTIASIGLLSMLFFVIKPYLGVIFLSSVFAISFYPVYQKFLNSFNNKNLAALSSTLVILIFVIVPVFVLSFLLLKETSDIYNSIAFSSDSSFVYQISNFIDNITKSLFKYDFSANLNIENYLRESLSWISKNFGTLSFEVFDGILKFVLMIISTYYLFLYGEKIKNTLKKWSPLPDGYDEEFIKTLTISIEAVFKGRIIVSIVQGFFIGLGFVIFDIGSPVLWGFVGAITSLIPILGTAIVTIPAIAFLFITGDYPNAIGLVLWSALIVGFLDNVISIIFMKDKIKVHPMIILFSILGGVELFGAIGFLVGPVIVSAFFALMQIYPFIISYNKVDN